jgi:hypothetical protein
MGERINHSREVLGGPARSVFHLGVLDVRAVMTKAHQGALAAREESHDGSNE